MRKIPFRVWVLIISLVFAVLAINPRPWASGIEIRSVDSGSPEFEAGLRSGEIVKEVNHQKIESLINYQGVVDQLGFNEQTIKVKTDRGEVEYPTTGTLGFVHEDLIVRSVESNIPIEMGAKIEAINGKQVSSVEDLQKIEVELFEQKELVIKTGKAEYAFLISSPPQMQVGGAKKSNIKKGLELQGGTRLLMQPVAEGKEITDQDVQDMIDVLGSRLDVYGIADLKIRPANDLAGNKFIVLEMAGVSKEEIREVVARQGKFEAKIGSETVFRGGEQDVTFVCRNDGSCAGIRPPCVPIGDGQYTCTFQFAISITEEAAKKHAEVTKDLLVNMSNGGGYLEKKIDFYLDDKVVDSLNIGADLKGKPITNIAISGPGFGPTEEAAYNNALEQMNRLQTILITGSLPFKLEVVKADTISPVLGQEFVKNSLLVAVLALVAVTSVMFIRYRKLKIVIPIMITSLSEITLTLGIAALINWNLDLASIAGIIAAVGTGVTDQIVISDEVLLRTSSKYLNWKEKIKRAFFVILASYVTLVAAMIPLWNAGAGLVRGFAVTTIIGVTVGVFITRPAYASAMERMFNK